jgi:hypothetical protein
MTLGANYLELAERALRLRRKAERSRCSRVAPGPIFSLQMAICPRVPLKFCIVPDSRDHSNLPVRVGRNRHIN